MLPETGEQNNLKFSVGLHIINAVSPVKYRQHPAIGSLTFTQKILLI